MDQEIRVTQDRDSPSNIEDSPPAGPTPDEPYPANAKQAARAEIHDAEVKVFETSRFAEKEDLWQWFPQLKDDPNSKEWRIWLSRRSRALMVQIIVILAILLSNFGLTVFAASQFNTQRGVGLIYQGDCATVGKLNLWLHLLINLLSTGMLSASNYCMQLQAAPTRANVNDAHTAGKWLDIGVPSLRNLLHINGWRKVSWALLAFSSIPIHLIYNSAVFQSLSSFDYTVAVVKDSFLDGADFSLSTAEINRGADPGWNESRVNPPDDYAKIISDMRRDALSMPYLKKTVSECFDLYDDYFAPQGNVLIFVKNQTVQTPPEDSLLMYVSIIPRSDGWGKNMWALGNGTGSFVALSPPKPVTKWFLGPPHYEVSRCLVQPPALLATQCRFEYSPWIMWVVCSLNLIKALVMLFIWAFRRWQAKALGDEKKEVLYTLGDAISSFMRVPDERTQNMCLATKHDFTTKRTWRNRLVKEPVSTSQEPREFKIESKRWMAAASLRRWIVLISMFLAVIGVSAGLLFQSFPSLRRRNVKTTLSQFWKMGFGKLQPYAYLVIGLPRADPEGFLANVVVSNLPQLILSILYIFYNSMLSTFLVQREFSRMCDPRKRKPLRVSEPIGLQRSSYFISLPLRYGIPLYLSSGLMHWLISQSLFLARITALRPSGAADPKNSFSTCGYSPIAIFITLLVGLVLVLAIVLIGFRTYDGTMRMVSTNSRAIGAACHSPEKDRENGYMLPVRWGCVEMTADGVGKCAFTTAPDEEIQEPVPKKKYR